MKDWNLDFRSFAFVISSKICAAAFFEEALDRRDLWEVKTQEEKAPTPHIE